MKYYSQNISLMNLKVILQNSGLNDKQAQVYLSCLELGKSTVLQISRKSGIKRPTCYVLLDELESIGYIKKENANNKVYFHTEDPKKILFHVEQSKRELESALPFLQALDNKHLNKPVVKYLVSVNDIRDHLEKTLKGNKMIHCIYSDIYVAKLLQNLIYMYRNNDLRIKTLITPMLSTTYSQNGISNEQVTVTAGNQELQTNCIISKDSMLFISYTKEWVGLVISEKKIVDMWKACASFVI